MQQTTLVRAELADLVYNGLLDYKASHSDFPDVDLGSLAHIAASINSVMNPADTEDAKSIKTVFPDLFNAYYDTFDNVQGITALANSKIQTVINGDFTDAEKMQLLGGLAIYPSSISYWEDVISNVGNPWHAWLETYAGSGNVPIVVTKNVPEADALGFLSGFGGKLGVELASTGPIGWGATFAYGVGSAAGYSIGALLVNAWNLVFNN